MILGRLQTATKGRLSDPREYLSGVGEFITPMNYLYQMLISKDAEMRNLGQFRFNKLTKEELLTFIEYYKTQPLSNRLNKRIRSKIASTMLLG